MSYGITSTGYVRKPLSVILAELEDAMITEFGPGVIQTPQSPLGQWNGLAADLKAEIDELNQGLYQSVDPDQAEGTRLDILAKIRLIQRGLMTDEELRKAITNDNVTRFDIQDLSTALRGLSGVTYVNVAVNEGTDPNPEFPVGFVSAAVIGGNDAEIAEQMRKYIAPGISTFGNVALSISVDGLCRSFNVIRPVLVDVTANISVKLTRDRSGCPAPSLATIKQVIENEWNLKRQNGIDIDAYQLRSIIESNFSNVEFVSFTATTKTFTGSENQPVNISFFEIANLIAQVTSE